MVIILVTNDQPFEVPSFNIILNYLYLLAVRIKAKIQFYLFSCFVALRKWHFGSRQDHNFLFNNPIGIIPFFLNLKNGKHKQQLFYLDHAI